MFSIKKALPILLLFLCCFQVEGAIFYKVLADRPFYRNGELIHISIDTDQSGLRIFADFSQLDSLYDPRMVFVENLGLHYDVYYPVTLENNKSGENFTVFINAYNPATGTSNGVTYKIDMRGEERVIETSGEFELGVSNAVLPDETVISVGSGQVMVCRSSLQNCSFYSDVAYDLLTSQQIINDTVVIYRDRNVTEKINLSGVEIPLNDLITYVKTHPSITQDDVRKMIRQEFDGSIRPVLVTMSEKFDDAEEQRAKESRLHFWLLVGAYVFALCIFGLILYAYQLRKKSNYIR